MNAKVITSLFIGLFLLGLGFLIISSNRDENPAASTNPAQQETEQSANNLQENASTAEPAQQTGTYADYSSEALTNAQDQVVLFFHAPWCPQCRAIEEDIVAQGVPSGYTILKVDYDSNQALRNTYNIRLQTSFVKVNSAGEAQDEVYVAYNEPTLDALQRDYLD